MQSFSAIQKEIDGGFHFRLLEKERKLTFREVLELWKSNQEFRLFYRSLLQEILFSAWRWETPPVKRDTADIDFEFVVLRDSWLDGPADPAPFQKYFITGDNNSGIVVFENLGKDAVLIVPSPRTDDQAYTHIGAFCRGAPEGQVDALWKQVGHTMTDLLSDQPVWLSTAGGGVAWLHIRLDNHPKYYRYGPYKSQPGII